MKEGEGTIRKTPPRTNPGPMLGVTQKERDFILTGIIRRSKGITPDIIPEVKKASLEVCVQRITKALEELKRLSALSINKDSIDLIDKINDQVMIAVENIRWSLTSPEMDDGLRDVVSSRLAKLDGMIKTSQKTIPGSTGIRTPDEISGFINEIQASLESFSISV